MLILIFILIILIIFLYCSLVLAKLADNKNYETYNKDANKNLTNK